MHLHNAGLYFQCREDLIRKYEGGLNAIYHLGDSAVSCAMRAAVETAIGLDAVTDDPAFAVFACRRQHVDGAFEAVEDVCRAIDRSDFERLVVRVSAELAGCHGGIS